MENELICPVCMADFLDKSQQRIREKGELSDFMNRDDFLLEEAEKVRKIRSSCGLEGLVGDLDFVIINVEGELWKDSIDELLKYTGLVYEQGFENEEFKTGVLRLSEGADILIQSRKSPSPWRSVENCPKARHLPNTRLESFVYSTSDIKKYFNIQKKRGVRFMTDSVIENDNYYFIQTIPSTFTELSTGFVQWKNDSKDYKNHNDKEIDVPLKSRENGLLKNIKYLDHAATRVTAGGRDAAIIEFMHLTNYNFQFSVYVKLFNSITNVARLGDDDFAMVFTSGIKPYVDEESSGPTEKFVHNYGKRVHHLAFCTEDIKDTVASLEEDGLEFLIGLVGNEREGLRQTFTKPSVNTLLVNEYIHRYGDFDGFFTKSNVTKLTGATDKQ